MQKVSLVFAALALSGCASAPLQLAQADPIVQTDAALDRPQRANACPVPAGDTSARAARCARADLVRRLGPSISFGF